MHREHGRFGRPATVSLLLVALLAAGCSSGAPPGPAPAVEASAAARAATICGQRPDPPAHYRHVVWIWMENQTYRTVIGSSAAPYENALARGCGLATNYHGVGHPSLPNYLGATGGSTFGVNADVDPASQPITGTSLFAQVSAAHLSWRSEDESMPANCTRQSSGLYAVKHNPAVYYSSLRAQCHADDVPYTGFGPTLPSFTFVAPNLCNDTHDCPVSTGDTWLARNLGALLASRAYTAGQTVIFITWDEGENSANHIPTIVVSPSTPRGVSVSTRFDHYSLLATAEQLLGLPRLGAAASAPSMVASFGL